MTRRNSLGQELPEAARDDRSYDERQVERKFGRVVFSRKKDDWETPQAFFDALHAEFDFCLDVAATRSNSKCGLFLGPGSTLGEDGLNYKWALLLAGQSGSAWMNPPYSKCRQFMSKAAHEARHGATVVCLVPSRTDTRWFHDHVYDTRSDRFRPGVEVRFIKGRLRFGGSTNSAPFPSLVIVFRPVP
jgi:phage N-6-adenine-methyltransferase